MILVLTLTFVLPAAALEAGDLEWMRKVDYRRIKQATDRCKEIRRSCLAFAEAPITPSEWSRILAGLSPEEVELMRRRYSISEATLAAARAAALPRRRPRGPNEEPLRDAVGSLPATFLGKARERIARVGVGTVRAAPPAVSVPRASRPAPRTAPRPVPSPVPAGVPEARKRELRRPLEAAAGSGRLDVAYLERALRWAKANPPADEAEAALRKRAGGLMRKMGDGFGPAQDRQLSALSEELGLRLDPKREANLRAALRRGLGFFEKLRLAPLAR